MEPVNVKELRPRPPQNRCILAASPGDVMRRMRVVAIGIAVLLVGAAVAVVVLSGRMEAEPPACWGRVKSSEPGKCPDGVGRVYKGACYMPNWAECAKSY